MPYGITRPQLVNDLHFMHHMFAISIRFLDCLIKKNMMISTALLSFINHKQNISIFISILSIFKYDFDNT